MNECMKEVNIVVEVCILLFWLASTM
jgi:hypothetical protein